MQLSNFFQRKDKRKIIEEKRIILYHESRTGALIPNFHFFPPFFLIFFVDEKEKVFLNLIHVSFCLLFLFSVLFPICRCSFSFLIFFYPQCCIYRTKKDTECKCWKKKKNSKVVYAFPFLSAPVNVCECLPNTIRDKTNGNDFSFFLISSIKYGTVESHGRRKIQIFPCIRWGIKNKNNRSIIFEIAKREKRQLT